MSIPTIRLFLFAAVLVPFGFLYDRLIGWVEREGHFEGTTSLQVVLGVLATIATYAMYRSDWQVFVELLVMFGGSGLFMVLGSLWRFSRANRQARLEAEAIIRRGMDDQAASGWSAMERGGSRARGDAPIAPGEIEQDRIG